MAGRKSASSVLPGFGLYRPHKAKAQDPMSSGHRYFGLLVGLAGGDGAR